MFVTLQFHWMADQFESLREITPMKAEITQCNLWLFNLCYLLLILYFFQYDPNTLRNEIDNAVNKAYITCPADHSVCNNPGIRWQLF